MCDGQERHDWTDRKYSSVLQWTDLWAHTFFDMLLSREWVKASFLGLMTSEQRLD